MDTIAAPLVTKDMEISDWYRGLTLEERAKLFSAHPNKSILLDQTASNGNRRYAQWADETIFKQDQSLFAERLAQLNLSDEAFRAILELPAHELGKDMLLPEWFTKLTNEFTSDTDEARLNFFVTEDMAESSQQQTIGFLNLVEPILRQAKKRVHDKIEALNHPKDSPIDTATIDNLLIDGLLRYLLYSCLMRTLVLELNVARLQGLLGEGSPDQRFQNFVTKLQDRDYALQLFSEYPVLARQVMVVVGQWENISLEFAKHILAEWPAIKATFSPNQDPGKLTQLQTGAGDKHREGRSVFILGFSSGFRLVYKPRSLAVDIHFQELLTWLNQRGNHPSLRTLQVLDFADHGWIEFVEAGPCESPAQIERFYERQGAYLALLFALKATDFHYENLIAAGEHPILIDLESLFHPPVDGFNLRESDLEQAVGRTIQHSVLSVGLLPQRIWGNEDHAGVDISGLGGKAGQLSPSKVPTYEQIGTDSMHLTRKHMEMPGGNNRPSLNGNDIKVNHYTEAIVKGFTDMYSLLLSHRGELLSDDGPLARFGNDEVRIIVRPTRIYAILLYEASHPDLMRDGLDRDRFFDRLWVSIPERPFLKSLIPAEQHDLANGDVPIFTSRPNSLHLWASNGERFDGFFDQTGMTLVQEQLKRLDEENLAQQTWFIRASIAALTMGVGHAHWPIYQPIPSQSLADEKDLLAAACQIGDRLKMLALRGEDGAAWIGLSLVNEKNWTLLPMGLDLYNGIPGVILFLAYLGHVTGDESYSDLAKEGLKTIQRTLNVMESRVLTTGAFDGWAALIYTFLHLGVLWEDAKLLDQAESFVQHIPPLIEQDNQLDIIGGAAGAIGVLLGLYAHRPSPPILETARQYGEFLLAQAKDMPTGMGWSTVMSAVPLAGFSHGVAGIAWALLKLAAITKDAQFRDVALKALDYERTLYSEERNNWPDLRDYDFEDYIDDENTLEVLKNANPDGQKYMIAWCHGAPGVGIARIDLIAEIGDAEVFKEIDNAVQATQTNGFGLNHSLCHGDFGNLDFLLLVSERHQPELHDYVYQQANSLLASFQTHGWLCGVPAGIETPGLMTGLAGIGYALLRLGASKRVPSVLLLEPPRQ